MGQNYGSVKNCCYSGTVHGTEAGGIAGHNYSGSIENCYNIGMVSNNGGSYVGGIVGLNGSSVSNCYYLNTCGGEGAGTSKTEEEFKSGEVAWLLQNGQDTPEQVWGQKLGESGDTYPVFTSDTSKKVLKVTFATKDNENYAAKYTNTNGTVEMPENPERDNFTFKKWVKTKGADGEEFNEKTPITEDMTVYALGSITSGSVGECHLANDLEMYNTYGYEAPITVNLDECMNKAFKIPEKSEGSFTYKISDQSSLGDTVATIEDNILTILTGLKSCEYTITITATEKEPQYSLISLAGDSDLTLNVNFMVSKQQEKTPKLSIDYVNEILTGFESDASYTITAAGRYGYLEDGVLKLTDHLGKYIRVLRNPRDENHSTSTSWTRTLPTRPAAPSNDFSGVAPAADSGKGKITGTDTTMEYRLKTDGNTEAWKDCTEGEIEVEPGKTYEVRIKAVPDSAFASEIKEVNVPAFEPTVIDGTVTIDGDAIFGQQLTAVTTEVVPSSINFTYKWQRSGDDGGYTDIAGATESTYKITTEDIGKTIQLVVTADDPDYTGSLTSTPTDTVIKATISDVSVTANPSITAYTGAEQMLVNVTGNQEEDTIEYKVEKKGSGDAYEYFGTENKATDAGTYKVTVTVKREGHNDYTSSEIEVTIAKATPVFPTVEAVDGGAYEPDKKLSSVTVPEVNGGTLAWSDGDTVLAYGENNVDAVFTPENSENYEPTTITGKVKVNVGTAAISVADVVVSGSGIIMYDGEPHGLDVTLGGSAEGGTVKFIEGEYNADTDIGLDWLDDCPTVTEVGETKTITIKVSKENYNDYYVTMTITITDEPTVSGITVTPYSGVYDGNEHDAVRVDGAESSDIIRYQLNDGETTLTVPKITDAGTYSVTVTVERTGYHPYTTMVQVSIEQADSTFPTVRV